MDGPIHPPSPSFYIMIVQRFSAVSCGSAVGESPHSCFLELFMASSWSPPEVYTLCGEGGGIRVTVVKGIVSRDFQPSVFFIKHSPLGP
jgi:hypothetical protein